MVRLNKNKIYKISTPLFLAHPHTGSIIHCNKNLELNRFPSKPNATLYYLYIHRGIYVQCVYIAYLDALYYRLWGAGGISTLHSLHSDSDGKIKGSQTTEKHAISWFLCMQKKTAAVLFQSIQFCSCVHIFKLFTCIPIYIPKCSNISCFPHHIHNAWPS